MNLVFQYFSTKHHDQTTEMGSSIMDIKPSHICIDMNNFDTCNEPLTPNKIDNKSNINKSEEACNDEIEFAKKIADIYKEANNNILIQKRGIGAHSIVKEAINSLSKSDLSAITKPEYDKDDLIKLFSKKSESNNDETRIFSNAHKLFNISAHQQVSAPDRRYLTTTKAVSYVTDFAAVVGGIATFVINSTKDPKDETSLGKAYAPLVGICVATSIKYAASIYQGKKEHDAKLGDERNSALFKCTQSLAKDRLKGMELFEEKYIAASEFKLIPPETKPQEVSIQMP